MPDVTDHLPPYHHSLVQAGFSHHPVNNAEPNRWYRTVYFMDGDQRDVASKVIGASGHKRFYRGSETKNDHLHGRFQVHAIGFTNWRTTVSYYNHKTRVMYSKVHLGA